MKIFSDIANVLFFNLFFFSKAIVGNNTAEIPFEIILNFPVACCCIE